MCRRDRGAESAAAHGQRCGILYAGIVWAHRKIGHFQKWRRSGMQRDSNLARSALRTVRCTVMVCAQISDSSRLRSSDRSTAQSCERANESSQTLCRSITDRTHKTPRDGIRRDAVKYCIHCGLRHNRQRVVVMRAHRKEVTVRTRCPLVYACGYP